MVEFIYLDETETRLKSSTSASLLFTLVAVMVPEDRVRALTSELSDICQSHLGFVPENFEFHAKEIWDGASHWQNKTPEERLTVLREIVALIENLNLRVAHATIDKTMLLSKYGPLAVKNSYRLALQFLLEKIDSLRDKPWRLLVADEAAEHQLKAITMTQNMQMFINSGVVPGNQIKTVIDSMHFVKSEHNAGVQLADTIAFIVHRARLPNHGHESAAKAVRDMRELIGTRTSTWRSAWPSSV